MNAVIYARVSREEQKDENQLAALEEWAASRGFEVTGVYNDVGSAWQQTDQKELSRLLEDCRVGKVATVLLWDLSRLTRKGVLETLQLMKQFSAMNITVLSYQDAWLEKINIPGVRDFLIGFLGYVHQEYSRLLSERTKAGLARARAEGKHIGRPKGRKDRKKRSKVGYYLRGMKNDKTLLSA